MGDLFFKALKWFFFLAFIIAGLACLQLFQFYGTNWAMPALLCFAPSYFLSNVWKDLQPKTMVFSIVLIMGLAALGYYIDDILYITLGISLNTWFFIRWGAVSFVVGIPAMMMIYHRYE